MISALSITTIERFSIVNEQILQDPTFSHGLVFWSANGVFSGHFNGSQHVVLDNTRIEDNGVIQRVPIKQSPNQLYAKLSFEAEATNIKIGVEDFAGASSTIIFFTKNGLWHSQYSVVHLLKSSPLRTYSRTLRVPADVVEIGVTFRLLNASGQLLAANPRLGVLIENDLYSYTRLFLSGLWCTVAAGLVIILCIRRGPAHAIATTILVTFLIASMLLPPTTLHDIGIITTSLELIEKTLNSINVKAPFSDALYRSGFQHIAIFILIGLYCSVLYRRYGTMYCIFTTAVIAIATESMQMLVDNRSTSFDDLVFDIIGGTIGLSIGRVFAIPHLPAEPRRGNEQK
jgi:hypothetical protein